MYKVYTYKISINALSYTKFGGGARTAFFWVLQSS
jgi:hypothetical protein